MNFLKNIAEKAKSVADSPTRSLGRDGDAGDGSQEGFICPLCFRSFPTAEALQIHFESRECGADAAIVNSSPQTEKRFGSLDLHTPEHQNGNHQKSENGFRERDLLSSASEENMFLDNQVKALEESKSLLTTEVVSLRQRVHQLETDHVPNGKILDRANELAAENVGLKAAVDDLTSENVSLKERVESLNMEMATRDSKDDSSVLKQELINVQRAMDEAMKEKEAEYVKLKQSYEDLFYERQNLVESLSSKDELVVKLQQQSSTKNNENEQEIAASIQQLNNDIDGLRTQVKEKNDMVKERDSKILNLSRTLEQKITLLEEKLENEKELKVNLEQSKSLMKAKNAEFEEVKKSVEALQKQENKSQDKIKEQEESLKEQTGKLESLTIEKDSLSLKLKNCVTNLEKQENDLTDKQRENQEIKEKLEEKNSEVSRLNSEREELLAKIEAGEGINEAIQQLKTENLSLQEKIASETNKFETRESHLVSKIETLETQSKSFQERNNELTVSLQKSNSELSEKDSSLQKVLGQNESLLHKQTELENETEAFRDKIRKSEVEQIEKLDSLRSEISDKDKENQKLKVKCDKLEEDNSVLEISHKNQETSINDLKSEHEQLKISAEKLKEQLDNEKKSSEKLQSSLISANKKESELELKIKNLEANLSSQLEDCKLLKEAKNLVQKEKCDVEKLLEEKTNQCQDLSVVLEANKFRINELETGLKETEVNVNEMRAAIDEALGKERNLLSDIEEKNKTIFAIEEEKANIVISFESQQTILERLNNEKDKAETDLRKIKSETEQQEEKICELQRQMELTNSKTEEEISELRTGRDILLSQIVELRGENETLSSNIIIENEQNQARVAALEIKLQDSKLNCEKFKQDLEKETKLHLEAKNIHHEEKISFEKQVNDSQNKISSLSEDVSKLKAGIATAEKDRDDALSKNLELEAGVSSALDERRGLLERCVAAESETERTRNITVELRRKLDDAHAALHELGRENQSIQVELVKQSGRKWKDDAEVTCCSNCGSGFSLTNRKHHCRNCGNIFCNDCSAKQAIMEGYKKPQRVCDSCFSELSSG